MDDFLSANFPLLRKKPFDEIRHSCLLCQNRDSCEALSLIALDFSYALHYTGRIRESSQGAGVTQQQPNWTNRTMWTGDNLDIMRGMNSNSVDLIYLDPPFNSNQNYSAPIGSEAAGAAFKDTWTLDDVDLAWHGEIADREPALHDVIAAAGSAHSKGMKAYTIMMAVRLLEMKRVLKETGGVYLHCDPTASHYLKLIMDAVFGRANFRNEIAWHYGGPSKTVSNFPKKHDAVFLYSKSSVWTFNPQFGPLPEYMIQRARKDADGRLWVDQNLGNISSEKEAELDRRGYTFITKAGKKRRKQYLDEMQGRKIDDVWQIPIINSQSKERIGYPTQKPLELLERIIKASSNEGDMVLDPFCGCATACVAAERLNRQWAGIDLSPKAAQLVKTRIEKDNPLLFTQHPMAHRTDIPKRTDLGNIPRYRTHKHTLFGKQEGVCAGCQTAFPFRNFTIDHIVPRSKGGSDHLDNLQLLCGACNSVKGNRSQAFLVAELRRSSIL